MKNSRVFLVTTLILVPQFAFASFDANLYKGTSGPQVQELQQFLIGQGLFSNAATGIFGPVTKNAVVAFQKMNGIVPASGFFGPLTRLRALQLSASSTVKNSSTSENTTSQIQRRSFTTPSGVIDGNVASTPPSRPLQTPQNAPTTVPVVNSAPGSTSTPGTAQTAQNAAHIDIISPIAGKGLGPRLNPNTGIDVGYQASSTATDESNYIVLGAVVYDDGGQPTSTATVQVTATDASQNKTLNGTGDVARIWPDGNLRVVPDYVFSYDFKTAGQHTITFTTGSLSKSITVIVK